MQAKSDHKGISLAHEPDTVILTTFTGLTKRQMWYDLASRYPVLDERRIRFVMDHWLHLDIFRKEELVSSGSMEMVIPKNPAKAHPSTL